MGDVPAHQPSPIVRPLLDVLEQPAPLQPVALALERDDEVGQTLITLDYVVLSHPHRDHVELLPDLFASYQVKEVWDSG